MCLEVYGEMSHPVERSGRSEASLIEVINAVSCQFAVFHSVVWCCPSVVVVFLVEDIIECHTYGGILETDGVEFEIVCEVDICGEEILEHHAYVSVHASILVVVYIVLEVCIGEILLAHVSAADGGAGTFV